MYENLVWYYLILSLSLYIYIFIYFFILFFFKKKFGTMILLERTSRTYISISSGHLLIFFQGSSYLII